MVMNVYRFDELVFNPDGGQTVEFPPIRRTLQIVFLRIPVQKNFSVALDTGIVNGIFGAVWMFEKTENRRFSAITESISPNKPSSFLFKYDAETAPENLSPRWTNALFARLRKTQKSGEGQTQERWTGRLLERHGKTVKDNGEDRPGLRVAWRRWGQRRRLSRLLLRLRSRGSKRQDVTRNNRHFQNVYRYVERYVTRERCVHEKTDGWWKDARVADTTCAVREGLCVQFYNFYVLLIFNCVR